MSWSKAWLYWFFRFKDNDFSEVKIELGAVCGASGREREDSRKKENQKLDFLYDLMTQHKGEPVIAPTTHPNHVIFYQKGKKMMNKSMKHDVTNYTTCRQKGKLRVEPSMCLFIITKGKSHIFSTYFKYRWVKIIVRTRKYLFFIQTELSLRASKRGIMQTEGS